MIAYPDTSFLFALYRSQVNSLVAVTCVQTMREPLHISSPVLFEFRQAVRFQEFLHGKNSRLGFDRATGLAALTKVQSNIIAGVVVLVPSDWPGVLQTAERLSARYTASFGHRAFDILHVATALHLGAKEFLSFDANQKKLAKAEGLKTPI